MCVCVCVCVCVWVGGGGKFLGRRINWGEAWQGRSRVGPGLKMFDLPFVINYALLGSVRTSHACVRFSGYLEMKVIQAYN